MTYSLYKYSDNNFKAKLTANYKVEVFRPTLFKPFLEGYTKSCFELFIYLYWLFISHFNLAIYYVKDGNQIVHTSLVTSCSYKFPFMTNRDCHIGPCFTKQEYRGLAIYPNVLRQILQDYNSNNGANYMIIEDSNISSIRGVLKVGFEKISGILKLKSFGIYKYNLPIKNWQYYNHAVMPTTEPNQSVDIKPLEDGSIWNIDGNKPLFARYTTDFDCGYETDWYYIIKDTPYEIESLKSNRRKKITKGRKYFYTKVIKAKDFKEKIANICELAFLSYPEEYRPNFSKLDLCKSIDNGDWDNYTIIGVFSKDTNDLVGYVTTLEKKFHIEALQHKVIPSYEKYNVNYALVDGMLDFYNDKFSTNKYICNGAKNIFHHTAFFDLLCECFGYRKAFCKLHMVYNPLIRPFVNILYLFRRCIKSVSCKHPLLYKINAVLEMERIARKCRPLK